MKTMTIPLALLTLSLIMTGCSDRNPVAAYHGGEIRRSDLKEAMRTYDESRQASIVGNMEAQKNEIRMLVERRLMVKEAQARGIDKSPQFRNALIREIGSLKRSVYQSAIVTPRVRLTGSDFDRLAVGYSTGAVFAPVAFYLPADMRAKAKRGMLTIISNMRAHGVSNIGAAGPLPADWRIFPMVETRDYYSFDPEIAPMIASMKEGEIRLIDASFGYMALILYGKQKRDPKVLQSIKNDSYGREQYRAQKIGWMIRSQEQRLIRANDIRRSYGILASSPASNAVLAQYRDYTFTYCEFIALLSSVRPPENATDMQKMEYQAASTNWIMQCALIEQEVSRAVIMRHYAGLWIDNHPSVRHERYAIHDRVLADTLIASVASNARMSADVGPAALRDFYEAKKRERYIDPRGATIAVPLRGAYVLSFDAVSDRIPEDVRSETAARAAEGLIRTLTDKAALHFYVENFLTAIPFPTPKMREQKRPVPPPVSQPAPPPLMPQKKKENPLRSFIDTVLLGGRSGIASRAYADLSRAYLRLESVADDRRATLSPSVTNAIERADKALIHAFRMGTPDSTFAVKAFEFYYDHEDIYHATRWIGRLADVPDLDIAILTNLLNSPPDKRAAVIDGIGYINDPRIYPVLEPLLAAAKDDQEKMIVIDALGRLRDYRAVKPLEKYLYNAKEIWGVRVLALEALKSITGATYSNVNLTPR